MAESISTKYKKGQVWGLDLIIACIIFFIGIITLYTYTINFSNQADENIDELFYEGNILSSIILSEGSPQNWDINDVISPGLTVQDKINETKLNMFYTLSLDYTGLKKMLNIKDDFYFFFSEMRISESVEGIGKPGVNSTNIIQVENPKNIVKITRFTVFKNKPVVLNLYTWN